MKTLLLLICLALSSCALPTMIRRPDGTLITLGGSLLEDTDTEGAEYTSPTGERLAYVKTNKNQTKVAIAGIAAWGVVGTAKEMRKATEASEVTARNASNNAAGITNTKTTAGVDTTAIKAGAPLLPR